MTNTFSSRRPLAGYRVVDFGQYIAGPAVAMMLADQGAEVIHIDPPGGPRWDNPADAILNRGKQRVILDLKTPEDLAVAQQLVAHADVLIENFRPDVMDKLGLGAENMRRDNPALVYLSLPGFSEQDPQLADTPAWEGIIAAAVGQYTDMGLNRILMGINPSYSPLPLASAYASVLGATAVTLALFARHRHSRGERIEVPVSAALMEGLAYNSMFVHGLPDRYKSPRELEIERRRRTEEPLNLEYPDLQEFLDPFYRTYVCADGRPFYAVCSSHTRHPRACLEVLGLWDEVQTAGIPTHSAYMDQSDWPADSECTLVSYPLSRYWAELVSSKMKRVFATKPAYEWQQIFGDAGVPGCAHQLTREWLNSEHAQACGSILKVKDPRYGNMRQLGNICWLGGDTAIIDKRPAGIPGQDNGSIPELLARWKNSNRAGVGAGENPSGGWLDGIRILDLTNVIAGPTIAGTLSRFGAEVISIDPPEPALDPWNSTVFGMQANQGKQSLLLDIKSVQGKQVLARLLPDIDVITINASDAQLQRLGLSLDELQAINPQLILCQFDAYGGPLRGPRSDHPGYDDLVQATTGIMSRFGGGMDTPEEHAHFGTIDVLGGYCAAHAIGVALVNRACGHGGSLARSSLIAAGQLIQVPFMFDYPERGPFNEPSGRYIKGQDALYRCYQAADGWFFLAVNPMTQLDMFAELTGQVIDVYPSEGLEDILETLFLTRPVAYWQGVFKPADIACQPLLSMGQWRESQIMMADGPDKAVDLSGDSSVAFVRYADHPCGYTVDLIAPNAIRTTDASVILPTAMHKYGEDTRRILSSLNFTAEEVDDMLSSGTAAISWSKHYLPR